MRILIIVALLIGLYIFIPYVLQFSPNKFYLLFCLGISLASLRAIYRYILNHWKECPELTQTLKLNASHVAFQAVSATGGLFIVLCFALGMLTTSILGSSTIDRGTVVSSRSWKGCLRTRVQMENAGIVRLCADARYRKGSIIFLKVRRSAIGHYVEDLPRRSFKSLPLG